MIGYIYNTPHASLHMWDKPEESRAKISWNIFDIENTTSHNFIFC